MTCVDMGSARKGECMSKKTRKIIYLVYGIVLSICLATAGVCLALSCVSIYQKGGTEPFTREIVEEALGKIAIPLWLCVGATAVGALLTLILPPETDDKLKGRVETRVMISKLMKKVDVKNCDPSLTAKIRREKAKRLIFSISAAVFSVLLAIPAVICFMDTSLFAAEEENNVVVALCFTTLGSILALCGWITVSFVRSVSLRRELTLVKEVVKTAPAPATSRESEPVSARETVIFWSVRGVVFAAAVALIVLGITGGGMTDVLENAIKICTSCIGLG